MICFKLRYSQQETNLVLGSTQKKTREVMMSCGPYSNLSGKGMIEYEFGKEPSEKDRLHGNARWLRRPYRRTSTKVHQKIKESIRSGKTNTEILEETFDPNSQESSQVCHM